MSFKLLKNIISYLRRKSLCPYCKTQLQEDTIFVIAAAVEPVNGQMNALFFVVCPNPKCMAPAMLFVEALPKDLKTAKQNIRITSTPMQKGVTINEILDMHNFLKDWKGDIKELFK